MSRYLHNFLTPLILIFVIVLIGLTVVVQDLLLKQSAVRIAESEVQGTVAAGLGDTLTLLSSMMIIVREGLEAVLIIGAILGYMRATRAPRRYAGWLAAGVIGAIALSLVAWVAAQTIITLSDANREVIEGITNLLAVAVLFYVTNWLFQKAYVQGWMAFVTEKVGKALSGGSALVMAGLGFIVVFREGLETVLFYQALLFEAPPLSVFLGFVAGAAIIGALAYLILRLSQRIPLKPFFTATTVLLLFLAFSFAGAGIHELQEAGVLSETKLAWPPESALLKQTFGLYPTGETLLVQALFLLAVAATFIYSHQRRKQQTDSASL